MREPRWSSGGIAFHDRDAELCDTIKAMKSWGSLCGAIEIKRLTQNSYNIKQTAVANPHNEMPSLT